MKSLIKYLFERFDADDILILWVGFLLTTLLLVSIATVASMALRKPQPTVIRYERVDCK